MATLTSKLKLSKPDYNDVRDIKVLNNNADLIDKFATDIENTINNNKTLIDRELENLLLETNIKGTIQTITKDSEDKISRIEHKSGGTVVRRDTFTYNHNQIIESRELVGKNKTLTLDYNLTTLEVVVS